MVRLGRLPERPMGADCKSVAKATEVRILYLPRGKAPGVVRGPFACNCSWREVAVRRPV